MNGKIKERYQKCFSRLNLNKVSAAYEIYNLNCKKKQK